MPSQIIFHAPHNPKPKVNHELAWKIADLHYGGVDGKQPHPDGTPQSVHSGGSMKLIDDERFRVQNNKRATASDRLKKMFERTYGNSYKRWVRGKELDFDALAREELNNYVKDGLLDDWAIVGKAESMNLNKAKAEYPDERNFFTVKLHESGKTIRIMGFLDEPPKTGSAFGLLVDRIMSGGASYKSMFGEVVEDNGKNMPLYFYD